jgi:hypothetical protein
MANLITISTPQSPFLSLSTSNNLTLTNTEWGKIIGDIEDQTDLQESLTAINNSIANSVNSINAAISLLQQAINLKQSLIDKGAANGYASLNSEGKVPQSQLDVATQILFYTFYTDLPKTGEINKFYFVSFDSILYFWDGAYISISSSDYLLNFSSHINSQYLTLIF